MSLRRGDLDLQEHGSRIEWIDIAKALGIFLVIAGHTGLPIYLKSWIYAFHMPMFFIISGLWFRDLCGIERMKKTIKSYLKPYFLYSVIFLFLTFFVCRDTHQFLDNTMRIFVGGELLYSVVLICAILGRKLISSFIHLASFNEPGALYILSVTECGTVLL